MLAQCPHFDGQGGEHADQGTKRHEALAALMREDETLVNALDALDDESQEGVRWAAEYIRLHAPMSDHPLSTELHLNPLADDFTPIFENGGTVDYACGNHLFDFKWRYRDYTAQMAAYALGYLQRTGRPSVMVHVLYGDPRKSVVLDFTEESALTEIDAIIKRALDPEAKPVKCDYCDWCSRALTCPALTQPAAQVAAGRHDVPKDIATQFGAWIESGAYTGAIDDPAVMAMVLSTARALKTFVAAAEFRALEMATKEGRSLPGFELKSKAGRTYCHNLAGAFSDSHLPQKDFLECCDIRLNTSAKYPDKRGLVDAYASAHGLKKATAKRKLLDSLAAHLTKTKDTQYLKATTSTTEEEND